MFAPRVAKPTAKIAKPSTDTSPFHRAASFGGRHNDDAAQDSRELRRSIGNQAVFRLVRRQRLLENKPADPGKGAGQEIVSVEGAASGEFQSPSLFPAPALPEPIQTKLEVGAINDPLEQEADSVADQVMRMVDPDSAATPLARDSRDGATSEPEGGRERIHRKHVATSDAAGVPDTVHEMLRAPGQSLDAATRAYFEPRFGHDFTRVRVQTGAAAERSAREVAAKAYTVGNDIAFGAGWFAPHTQDGKRLLAHELAHVVQQSGGSDTAASPLASRMPAALRTLDTPRLGPTLGARLQRSPGPEIWGGTPTTGETVSLYHYGNLDGVTDFKSPPGYPRLSDCDIANSQAEAAQYTGTPINNNLRYKYEIKIDVDYFYKNFKNTGTRGAYSEYVTKESIPIKYFTKVGDLAGPPPSGGSSPGGTGGTPPSRTSGGGGTSTTPTSARVAAGAVLVVMGANVAFNGIIGALNERRIRRALDAKNDELTAVHQQQSNLGILLIFRFSGGASSGEGPTAAARFEGVSYLTALSRDNAMEQWRRQPRMDSSMHYEFSWIDAASPQAVPPADWGPVALAKFADLSEIEFQRMQFAQIGGFDTKGTVGPVDFSRHKFAQGYQFYVLSIPKSIPYYGPGGGREHKSVTIEDRPVAGGTVPAMIVDDTAIAAVVAANGDTLAFFHARGAQAAMEIDDKADALRAVPNIAEVRWLRLKQIQVIKKV